MTRPAETHAAVPPSHPAMHEPRSLPIPPPPVHPVVEAPTEPVPAPVEPQAGLSLTQQAQRLLERGSAARAAEIARKATTADPQNAEA